MRQACEEKNPRRSTGTSCSLKFANNLHLIQQTVTPFDIHRIALVAIAMCSQSISIHQYCPLPLTMQLTQALINFTSVISTRSFQS